MTEAEELQQYRTIAKKYNENPKLKAKYLRLYKEAFPEANVPEVDIQDSIRDDMKKELDERDKKIKELEERQYRKQFDDEYAQKKQRLSGPPWYLDDEGIKKAEELLKDMAEKPGTDMLAFAADHIRATTEPLKPSGLGILGFTPTQNSKQQRADFNKRFAPIFKNSRGNNEVLKDAIDKASSGEYLNEMQR